MKITNTRRSDYGIRAAIHLAAHPTELVKANDIAEEMEIPLGVLHQVLNGLQRGGLLLSQTGRTGGYSLSRPAEDITVLDVIEALEGPMGLGECALRGGPCHWEEVCALHEVWSACREAFCDGLRGHTVADVAANDALIKNNEYPVPVDSHRAKRR